MGPLLYFCTSNCSSVFLDILLLDGYIQECRGAGVRYTIRCGRNMRGQRHHDHCRSKQTYCRIALCVFRGIDPLRFLAGCRKRRLNQV